MKFRISRVTDRFMSEKPQPTHGATWEPIDGSNGDAVSNAWFIEINTIEELVELVKRERGLILDLDYLKHDTVEIEIYDDYSE